MFKAAATKLAHNSTIPALAGNSDWKALQDVITTEKRVLQSLKRLGNDVSKSSDALRVWAEGEGGDLEDTFAGCSTLLNNWASSLASFASHVVRIRECLKIVRTMEEGLDDLRRRRKSLFSKAESAEGKLKGMDSQNKNLRKQTDLLTNLNEQIHALDIQIVRDEVSLGDWKRIKAKEWMGILFGALLECSENGAVVATFGRTIMGHVSTEKTVPGVPRAHYSSHSEVQSLVVGAELELEKISFDAGTGDSSEQPPDGAHNCDLPEVSPSYSSPPAQSMPTFPPQPYASSTLPANPPSNTYGLNEFGQYSPRSHSQTYTPGLQTGFSPLNQPLTISPTSPNPFSTYPLQGSTGSSLGHTRYESQSTVSSGTSFSPSFYPSSVAPTLPSTDPSNNPSSFTLVPEARSPTDNPFLSPTGSFGHGWGHGQG